MYTILQNYTLSKKCIYIAVRVYVYFCNKDTTSVTTDVIALSPDKVFSNKKSFPLIHLALCCLKGKLNGDIIGITTPASLDLLMVKETE